MGEECCECGAESNGLMIAVVKYSKDTHTSVSAVLQRTYIPRLLTVRYR